MADAGRWVAGEAQPETSLALFQVALHPPRLRASSLQVPRGKTSRPAAEHDLIRSDAAELTVSSPSAVTKGSRASAAAALQP